MHDKDTIKLMFKKKLSLVSYTDLSFRAANNNNNNTLDLLSPY